MTAIVTFLYLVMCECHLRKREIVRYLNGDPHVLPVARRERMQSFNAKQRTESRPVWI